MLAQPASGLPIFIAVAGMVSLALGIDANWDLKNYHYYNPWALLHGRWQLDSAPAFIQTFHNPLPDLPFYALVVSGLPASLIEFALGVPVGVGAYFFFRIVRDLVGDLHIEHEGWALAAICVVAFTGSACLSTAGTTTNDWLVAAFVLPALFLLLRATRSRNIAIAGLLLGVAVGLKLTAAPYAVAGIVLALAGLSREGNRYRAPLLLAAFAFVGFALAYGYWASVLYARFDNPLFPYFNQIFRSEYWDPVNTIDERFRPRTLSAWLTWPFRLAERNRLMTEVDMREPRLAALTLVALSLAIIVAIDAVRTRRSAAAVVRERMPPSVRRVAIYTGAAYVCWLATSAVYRYTVPAELLASLLLVVGLHAVLSGAKYRSVLVGVACVTIVAQTLVPNWGRVRAHNGPYFDVRVPLATGDAMVLTTESPLAYLVPFMPPGARLMRLMGPYQDRPFPHRTQQQMHAQVAAHHGPLLVLRWSDTVDRNEEAMLAGYALVRQDDRCEVVRSNVESRRLEICPLARR